MLDKIILGVLHHEPGSMYEIKKSMEKIISNFYSTSFGSILPALRKLSQRKEVTSKHEVKDGRSRIIYSITSAGKKTFVNWLQEEIDIGLIKDEAALRLFFLYYLEKGQRRIVIKNYLITLDKKIKQLEKVRQSVNGSSFNKNKRFERPRSGKNRFERMTINLTIDYYRFLKSWYRKMLRVI